ncbi:MAG TPA: LPXTG cell wall anchor domain-containing protein [Acidimicrobiales bacterium]|nr:LPXTG cell wall anchor domain-containing protein [Acidimicrobiales bacterium]
MEENMIRRMLILAAVALIALTGTAHAQYGDGTTTVSDSTVVPGQTITVTTDGCQPGSEVTFFFDGEAAGSGTTDDTGTASADITVPADAAPGEHEISNDCNDTVITVTVLGDEAAVTTTLPRTGSDSSLPLAKVAIVLIAAGGLLLLVSRDRSRRTA